MSSYETTTTRLPHQPANICLLIEDLLPLYLEGEVSPGTRDLMVEHLGQCEHCAGFLAGAQSVRTQLRRGDTARAQSVAQDRPALQSISSFQRVVSALVAVGCGAVAMFISALFWAMLGFPYELAAPLFALLYLGMGVAVALRFKTLTITHWLGVLAAASVGSIGCFIIWTEPMGRSFGFLLVMLSLAALCIPLASGAATTQGQSAH